MQVCLVSVTSLAEVWIEIRMEMASDIGRIVTSLAEVWIEIVMPFLNCASSPSLPLRKCGLKYETDV